VIVTEKKSQDNFVTCTLNLALDTIL